MLVLRPIRGQRHLCGSAWEGPGWVLHRQSILDGVVVWRDENRNGALRVNGTLFLIRGTVLLVAPPISTSGSRFGFPKREPSTAARVSVRDAGHEHDLYYGVSAPPDVRRDWIVNAVLLERRALDGRECGDVTSVDPLEVMNCWADGAHRNSPELLTEIPHPVAWSG